MTIPSCLNEAVLQQQVEGNDELMRAILRSFCTGYENFHNEFSAVIAEQNTLVATRMAHQLRGAALNIAALSLAEKATAVEKSVGHGNFSGCEQMLESLQTHLQELQEYNQLAALESAQNLSFDNENYGDLKKTMLRRLDERRFISRDLRNELMACLQGLGLYTDADNLTKALDTFDYARAKVILTELKD